ncbi:MAG TPA: VOC family protein [Acetobacteraceae bacterium]|nr:VOC family protein [Acetobacteraceae bacterium]
MLTPELDVADVDRSLAFYVGVIGFSVVFDRPEERFVFLSLEGVDLMLEDAAGPGRRFRTAPLERPYGRGVSFMIEVADVDRVHGRVQAAGYRIVVPLEDRWYRRDALEYGRRQFVVADPDGYLLRFTTSLGQRPVPGG